MQQCHVRSTITSPGIQALVILIILLGTPSRGNHHDVCIWATGQFEKALVDLRRAHRSSHDNQ